VRHTEWCGGSQDDSQYGGRGRGDANLTGVASVGDDVFNRLPNPAHGPGKVLLVELIGS